MRINELAISVKTFIKVQEYIMKNMLDIILEPGS
jgi:hypothetical protein